MFKRNVLTLVFCVLLSGCASQGRFFDALYHRLFGTPETVRVQKGDTLYSIAKRYDISISELIELNDLDQPNQIHVGQVLKTSSNKYYVVKRGDTLASIARQYNTDYKTLAKNNNIQAPYNLKIGQKIVLNAKQAGSQKQTATQNVFSKSKSDGKSNTSSYKVSQKRKNKFIWPVSGKVILNFGVTGKGRKNDGINISAAKGSTVKAADQGVIAYAGNGLKGFGNLILIKHTDGYITAYAHNDKIFVKKGQSVVKGEKIATVGQTGGVSVPQLHFEVRAGKKAVNPKNYLP